MAIRSFSHFKDWAWNEYRRRYSYDPPWGSKDFAILHTIYKRISPDERVRAIWTEYLHCEEQFFQGHPPGKLLNQLSRFAADEHARRRATGGDNATPADGLQPGGDNAISQADRDAVMQNLRARGLEYRKGFLVDVEKAGD